MEILVHFVCIETLRVCGKRKYPFIVDLTNFSLQFLQHFFKAVAVQYLWLHLQEIASCLATSSSKSCNQAKQDKTKQLKSKHFRFQHDTLMCQRQGEAERQAGRRQGNVITLSATSFARLPAPPSFLLQLCLALWQWQRASPQAMRWIFG